MIFTIAMGAIIHTPPLRGRTLRVLATVDQGQPNRELDCHLGG